MAKKMTDDELSAVLDVDAITYDIRLMWALEYLAPSKHTNVSYKTIKRIADKKTLDPRSTAALTALDRYLKGQISLAELQTAASDAWQVFRELESTDADRSTVASICAASASLASSYTIHAAMRYDPAEVALQIIDLKAELS